MNLTEIEKEKYLFLQQRRFQQSSDFLLEVGIFDLHFKLHLSGISLQDYHFLCDYYKHFQVNSSAKKTITIYYQAFQDQRKNLDHEWYCSKWPARHFIPIEENDYYIIERDYAAYLDPKKDHVYSFGPIPCAINPDSLDNLLTTLFTSFNQEHDSLVLHSASVIRDQKAYVFFGESGAGKSTLAFHCYENFNQKVISSDQTYLSWNEGRVWAQSTPITIPEIKRSSPMREWAPVEVAGFIHLTQKGEVGLHPLTTVDFFKKFVCQSDLYLSPLSDQQKFLNLAKNLLEHSHLFGELTYEKNQNFWRYFS